MAISCLRAVGTGFNMKIRFGAYGHCLDALEVPASPFTKAKACRGFVRKVRPEIRPRRIHRMDRARQTAYPDCWAWGDVITHPGKAPRLTGSERRAASYYKRSRSRCCRTFADVRSRWSVFRRARKPGFIRRTSRKVSRRGYACRVPKKDGTVHHPVVRDLARPLGRQPELHPAPRVDLACARLRPGFGEVVGAMAA
jgi:hypothetical protein